MKIAATLVVFFAATASAFGLHNGVTSAVKTITKSGFAKPMVQAVDLNGNRLNAGVRKYNDTDSLFFREEVCPLQRIKSSLIGGIVMASVM